MICCKWRTKDQKVGTLCRVLVPVVPNTSHCIVCSQPTWNPVSSFHVRQLNRKALSCDFHSEVSSGEVLSVKSASAGHEEYLPFLPRPSCWCLFARALRRASLEGDGISDFLTVPRYFKGDDTVILAVRGIVMDGRDFV